MSRILRFRPRPHSTRACRGCGITLKAATPTHHLYCLTCWRYGQFRKAVQSFMQVRP